ncbi:hypothetical protein D3C80_1504210 [compost metagenome]
MKKQSLVCVRTLTIKRAVRIPIALLTIVYIHCVQYLNTIKSEMMRMYISRMKTLKILNKFKILKILRRFMYLAVMEILKNSHVVRPYSILPIMCIRKSVTSVMPRE